jgi:hypothetical protein
VDNHHWATPHPDETPEQTSERIARQAIERVEDFEETLRERDLDSMRLAHFAYYGCDEQGHTSARVSKEGSQEQVRYVVDDEFGTAFRNMLTIATAQPGGFLPVPINTNSTAQRASAVTRGVLEHYFDDGGGGLDRLALQVTEAGKLHHWAWVSACWDEDAGDPVEDVPEVAPAAPSMPMNPAAMPMQGMMPPGQPPAMEAPQPQVTGWTQTKTGDPKFRKHLATDVAFEYDARGDLQWVVIKTWENKFDLAAKLEQQARLAPTREDGNRLLALVDEVRSFQPLQQRDDLTRDLRDWRDEKKEGSSLSDEVPVYELRHAVTPGCPEGRHMRYLSQDVVLEDGPAKYGKDLLCHMAKAGEQIGTPRGFTRAINALSLQRMLDALTSIPYSSLVSGGLNWWVTNTNNFEKVESLNEALRLLYVKGDPKDAIVPLSLVDIPAETFPFMGDIRDRIDQKLGMNEFSMGRDNKDRPASMGALLDESAQRAVSDTAQMFQDVRLWMAKALVTLFAAHGEHSRTLPELVGNTKRAMMLTFSGEHFRAIASVRPEPVPALMRSTAGRLELARLKMESKAAGMDPVQEQALLQLVMTGRDEQTTDPALAQAIQIQEENERLLAGEMLDSPPPPVDPMTGMPLPPMPGQPPPVRTALWSDPHIPHILGHTSQLSLDVRRDPRIVDNTTLHVFAHLMQCGPEDLMKLTAMGYTLPPQFRPPPMLPGGPGAPPPEKGGKKPEGGTPAGQPQQANLPPTPPTPGGDRWSPSGAVVPQ